MFPNLSQAPGITQRNPVRNVPIPLPNNQSIPLGVQNRGPAFHGLTGKFSQSKPISSFISSPLNRGAPSVLSSPSSSLLSNAPVSSSQLMDRNSTPGKNHPSYKTQFNSIQDIQQRLDFYINLDQPIVPPSGIFNILFIRFFFGFYIYIIFFDFF